MLDLYVSLDVRLHVLILVSLDLRSVDLFDVRSVHSCVFGC